MADLTSYPSIPFTDGERQREEDLKKLAKTFQDEMDRQRNPCVLKGGTALRFKMGLPRPSPRPGDATVEKIATLIRHAIFNPQNQSVHGTALQQTERFEAAAHNLLATGMLSRADALQKMAERTLKGISKLALRNGEKVTACWKGTESGSVLTIETEPADTAGLDRA